MKRFITTVTRCKQQWSKSAASILLMAFLFSTKSFAQYGIAPIVNPAGGFNIDGRIVKANGVLYGIDWTPGNDWVSNLFTTVNPANYPNATTSITPPFNGVLYSGKIFHKIDRYDDQTNDDIFDGGNKLNDNPNDWEWSSQKPPPKDDINNSMLFVTQDANGHYWVIVSGDRLSTNGTSYLDVEFYQNSISKHGTTCADPAVLGSTGRFCADGPHNGRTVGDLSITLSYTAGGNLAAVSFLKWTNIGTDQAPVYDYVDTTISSSAYAAANNTGVTPTDVPYGAFGHITYDSLQYVEAAIDLTELIGNGVTGPCAPIPFHTVFIKTKSSASSNADLKDFIEPFAVNFCTDVVPPTVTPTSTASTALGCNPSTATIEGALGGATATDNCASGLTPTASDGAVGSSGCSRSQTRTWTATDVCGNVGTASRTVTWTIDVTAPVITASSTASTALGCNPSSATINATLGGASASDNCAGAFTPTASDGAVGSSGCARSQTRTWTATDGCGNTASLSRTITWTFDATPPVVTPTSTASTTLGCNPSTATIDGALGSATNSDNCSIQSSSVSDGAVGSTGCARSQTRTWTATDGCGNTTAASRTVTWTFDITPPSITASSTASLALGCNPSTANVNSTLGGATPTDNCSIQNFTSTDGPVGSTGCARSATRTWTATDGCGNTATLARTVTWTFDITAPVVTPSSTANTALGCNPSTATITGALDGATASDNCSGALTPTASDGAVGSTGCARSQTRTWSATDACGNVGTASRTVTWTFDITLPVVTPTATASTSLGCNPSTATIDGRLGGATASDNCNGALTPTASDGAIGSTGCSRSQTRTWSATDACGNVGTASRTVTWTFDIAAPVVTPTSTASTTLGCNPSTATITGALGGATATDNCSGALTPTANDGSVGSTGCARSQTRRWTATDACGNTATASRTVTWTFDITKPVITPTATSTTSLGCNVSSATVEAALGSATANDNCSGALTPSATDGAVGSTGCSRSQTRTWSATDACGNVGTASRTVTWTVDATPPVIGNAGSDYTTECNDQAFTPPTATDNCGSVSIRLISEVATPVEYACTRTVTRTWDAVDGCGNHSETRSQTLTLIDTQGPVFNCPNDKTIDAAQVHVKPTSCPDLGGGGAATVFGPPNTNGSPLNDNKVDFRQPRNQGHPAVPLDWTNGITNTTQAEYYEGMGVPQRIIFTNLSPGTHTFVFRHEAVKHQSGDRHAYDFLMSWEQAVATAGNIGNNSLNELQNLIAQTCNGGINQQAGNVCGGFTNSAFATLTDNMGNPPNHHGIRSVNDAISCFESRYGNRQIEMKANSNISNFSIVFNGYSGNADGDNYAWYTITWTSSSKDVMFKIAGRAAAGEGSCGYGSCFGAGDIDGGPYHFKLESLDNHSLGDRDNQIQLEPVCKTDIPVEFGTPHIHDCDPNPILEVTTEDSTVVNPDGSTSHYRKWRASDHCGNTSSCMQTITVVCEKTPIFTEILPPIARYVDVPVNENGTGEAKINVMAYPNPYNDNVRFVILSPVSGPATLDVYNMLGQKVQTVFQGFIAADRAQEVYYKVPIANRKNLIYILRLGDKQATGKLIRID